MKKILHAIAGAGEGGAEEFFFRLVRALQRRGVPQSVVMRMGRYSTLMIRSGFVPSLAKYGGMLDFTTVPRLRRAFDSVAPDIVFSWMSRATQFVTRARGGRTFVHVSRLGGYYDLKYYRGCNHLIGNTPDIVDYLVREGWPRDRAHFIPNFVDEAQAAPARRTDFHLGMKTVFSKLTFPLLDLPFIMNRVISPKVKILEQRAKSDNLRN